MSFLPDASTQAYLHSWTYQCYELLGMCSEALEAQQQQAPRHRGRVPGRGQRHQQQQQHGEGEGGDRDGEGRDEEQHGEEEEGTSGRQHPVSGPARGRAGMRRGAPPRRGLGGARRLAQQASSGGEAGPGRGTAALAALDAIAVRLALLQEVSPGSYQHAAMSAR